MTLLYVPVINAVLPKERRLMMLSRAAFTYMPITML
jgi:hypothetical protein